MYTLKIRGSNASCVRRGLVDLRRYSATLEYTQVQLQFQMFKKLANLRNWSSDIIVDDYQKLGSSFMSPSTFIYDTFMTLNHKTLTQESVSTNVKFARGLSLNELIWKFTPEYTEANEPDRSVPSRPRLSSELRLLLVILPVPQSSLLLEPPLLPIFVLMSNQMWPVGPTIRILPWIVK